MKTRTYAAIAALVLVASGCSSQDQDEPDNAAPTQTETSTAPVSEPTTTPTPRPTQTRPPEPGETLPPRATADEPLTFLFRCQGAGGKTLTFDDPEEVRQAREDRRIAQCDEPEPWGGTISSTQEEMLERSTSADTLGNETALGIIYDVCTRIDLRSGVGAGPDHAAANFLFAQNLVQACEEHPGVESLSEEVEAAAALPHIQAELEDRIRRDEGKYISGDARLLVGTEMPAGTWQTVSERVQDCYWEISDANGDIIDNNFIRVAPQLTITVPESAAGFTTEGCGSWRWID